MHPCLVRLLVLAVAAAALFVGPVAAAQAADFPLIASQVPLVTANSYGFDLVVHQYTYDPAAGKAANPRAVWIMTGVGGASYAWQALIDAPGFNKSRCLLRHANGSGWTGVQPLNITLPDCTDFIADTAASRARSFGLYVKPWDGIYQDSLSYHPYQYAVRTANGMTDIDANLDGLPDSQAALEAAWKTGMQRYTARLRANLPGKIVLANGADWGNTTDLNGVDGNLYEQGIDYLLARQNGVTIQFLVDLANRWYAVNTGRPRIYSTISYWKGFIQPLPANAAQLMQTDPDAQRRMRFGLATSLMAGMHYDFEYSSNPGSSAIYDEYRGGDLNKQGYLGQPLAAARQVSLGVWRRDFQNGVALANEGTAAATLNLSVDQLKRLKGTQNPVVNSGAAVSTVTIPSLDGIILLRGGATPAPPPAGTKQFGNTAPGGTWLSAGQGYKFGSVFPLADTATLVDFKWYTRGGSTSQQFTPVIYGTDSSGNPAGRLVVGSPVTVNAGQAPGWVTSALPATTLSPGRYLLGLTSGPTGSGAANAMTPSGTGYYNTNPYGAPTATWGALTTEPATWSYYVDYTTASGGGAPPPPPPPPPPSGTNLAPNPGLELDPAASYSTNGTAAFSWATDQWRSAGHSLKIVSAQPSGTLTRWMTLPALIPVTPAKTYTVSGWVKTAGAGAATVAASFYNGSFLPAASSLSLSGTNGWTLLTVQTTAPAGATQLRVEFRLFGPGTLWADDLSVTAG